MLKVSLSEVRKNDLSYFERKIIDSLEELIAYNPTYDLRYLYEVASRTIGLLISCDYGVAFTGKYLFISRMSDYKYIAEVVENGYRIT